MGGYSFNLDENNKIELGKALLLGTSWDARIPIGDQSAREELQQYTAEKEAEKTAVAAAVRASVGSPRTSDQNVASSSVPSRRT